MPYRCVAVVSTILALALSLAGCKTNAEEFSGLVGRVAVAPVQGASISVYDATAFVSLESEQGRIATATTDEDGAFGIALDDFFIGRPLIVVAIFQDDDPATTEDERASYVDYSPLRSTVVLDGSDAPWVSMVPFFEGLTVPVTISPFTTIAFHSLANLPASDVGEGNLRFTQDNIAQAEKSVAVNLGLIANPASVFPALPFIDATTPDLTGAALEETPDSSAYTYTLIQLDRAATAYANATDDTSDDQTDFFAALFDDAKDGLLDGRLNGQAVAYLVSAGAPDVAGQDGGGVSNVIAYITTNGVVSADETQILIATGHGMAPDSDDVLAMQARATGAVRTIRIDGIDLDAVPSSGGVEVTIVGAGFLSSAELILANDLENDLFPTGTQFVIDEDSQGDEGSIDDVRHDRLTFTFPDLTLSSVSSALNPTGGELERALNIFARFDFDGPTRNGAKAVRFADERKHFTPSGLHILRSRIVRLGSEREADATLNLEATGTDPQTLDPNVDDVYALELTVFNGSGVTVDDVTLDVGATAVNNGDNDLAVDVFGGAVANPVIVFPSQADLDAGALSLDDGETGTIAARFVLDQSQAGVAYDIGDLIGISPVVAGEDQTSADETVPLAEASFVIADPDLTPTLSSAGIENDATVDAGDTIELVWNIDVAGRASATHRSATIESITLTVTRPGQTPETYVVASSMLSFPMSAQGAGLAAVSAADEDGNGGVPLFASGDEIAIVIVLATAAGESGAVTVDVEAQWAEELTGFADSVDDTTTFTIVDP